MSDQIDNNENQRRLYEQHAEITPTPWMRRGATIGVRDPDGVLIMTARAFSGHSSQVGEQEANAAFIPAAVNACAEAVGTDLKARRWLEAGGLPRLLERMREESIRTANADLEQYLP